MNIDHKRNVVWVAGNQTDLTYAFDIKSETWRIIPMPKTTTFVREYDIDEIGSAYTVNSNFPAWHIESGQPTLMKIEAF